MVINVVSMDTEFRNRCRCQGTLTLSRNSEMMGVIKGAMTQKRSGTKRNVVKELNNH